MRSIIPVKNVGAFLCFLVLHYFASFAQGSFKESYRLETIEMPKGLSAQTGGIDFSPDGRLVACFMSPKFGNSKKRWQNH